MEESEFVGAEEIIIEAKDGEPGKDGDQGPAGKDGRDGKDGIDGIDGKDGKDGVDGHTPIKGVDYFDGKDGIPGEKGNDGSPDSPEQVRDKLSSLPVKERFSYNYLKDTPDIEQIVRLSRQASKTVSLVELDDVDLTGLTQDEQGKYILGSGGGGVQSVVAGTNVTVDNTDPANPIVSATGSVTDVTATSPLTSSGGTTPNISTSMSTNKLIGRSTAGTGVMEEISIGTGLSLSAGTLSSTISSPWQTTSNVVNLVTSTDNVTIGSATNLAKFAVDGDADEIQSVIQGHSSQTADLTQWQDSSAAVLGSFKADGRMTVMQTSQTFTAATTAMNVGGTGTFTMNTTGAFTAMAFNPSISRSQNGSAFGSVIFYQTTATIKNVAGSGVTELGQIIAYNHSASVTVDTDTVNVASVYGFRTSPTLRIVNGGTLTSDNLYGVYSGANINPGVTLTNRYGLWVEEAFISIGTLTNQYGIYIKNLTAAATINRAIHTEGGDVMFNSSGSDTADFTIQGDTDTDLFFLDASADQVQIGKLNINGAFTLPTADGTANYFLQTDGAGVVSWAAGGGGSGTVTDVSVVSANGFAGTVATSTTTPAITLTTTITGILEGNGTAISAASTTGSGAVVLANTPTLITPVLGVATGTSLTLSSLTAGRVTFAGTAGILTDDADLRFATDTLSIGTAGATTGKLAFSGSTSGTVTVQPANAAGTWTMTLPTTGGTNTYFLQTNGSGVTTWAAGNAGDVVGPASATDNAIARFNLTTGKLIQDSAVTIADTTGSMTIAGTAWFIGNGTMVASGANSLAVGRNASATGDSGLAIGNGASSINTGSISIGTGTAGGAGTSSYAIAIGQASAQADSATAIGRFANADYDFATAIARASGATAIGATAIGYASQATAEGATAISRGATASGVVSTAVGFNATATNERDTVVGAASIVVGSYATGVGALININGANSTAVGKGNTISAANSCAFGVTCSVTHASSMALGISATSTATNQLMIGSSGSRYDIVQYGSARFSFAGGNVVLGGGTTATELQFLEPSASGSNYTAFKAQAQAGNVTYTLPAADGSNTYVLQTNGSGTLSWVAPGSGITALTGDVTASGTGSVAATIANDAVTFAKFQNITDNRLLGRSAGSTGDMQEITVGNNLTLSSGNLSAPDRQLYFSSGATSVTADTYIGQGGKSTTINDCELNPPVGGTVTGFYVKRQSNSGAVTCTVYINGSASTSTVSFTDGGALTASDTTHFPTFTAGQSVVVWCDETSGAATGNYNAVITYK